MWTIQGESHLSFFTLSLVEEGFKWTWDLVSRSSLDCQNFPSSFRHCEKQPGRSQHVVSVLTLLLLTEWNYSPLLFPRLGGLLIQSGFSLIYLSAPSCICQSIKCDVDYKQMFGHTINLTSLTFTLLSSEGEWLSILETAGRWHISPGCLVYIWS